MKSLQKIHHFLSEFNQDWSLKPKYFFGNVFKNHKKTNEEVFIIDKHLKAPWRWSRILAFFTSIVIPLYFAVLWLGPIPFPWLALIVAMTIPLSIILLIYDLTKIEKIQPIHLIVIFFVGSTISLYVTGYLSITTGIEGLDIFLMLFRFFGPTI
ncbi:MAG: hypothetical protein WC152_07395 [Candidatus Izemoplasmatales bacterium]|jgi:hypothetical protein